MRVSIDINISEGLRYDPDGQVRRHAEVQIEEPEGFLGVDWGVLLGGMVESGIEEFLAVQAARELEEVEDES